MSGNKSSLSVVAYERCFGESGRGPGQYRVPRHIAVTPDGNLCISDSVNLRLQVVTPEGEPVLSFGSQGSGPGQLRGPNGVACDGPVVYVVEGGNHRVQKLRLEGGEPVSSAGSHGSKKGELWCPHGLAISKGMLYVADYINGRIAVYDASTMEYKSCFGSRGDEPGQLEYPCGVSVKGEEVYVAEYGNHRISARPAPPPASARRPVRPPPPPLVATSRPLAQVFTKRGAFVRTLGSEGKGPGQFYQPRGVLIVKGWVLVTEAKRVQILTPDGESKQVLELPGAGSLWGAAKDNEQQHAYVTDIRAGHAKARPPDASPRDGAPARRVLANRLWTHAPRRARPPARCVDRSSCSASWARRTTMATRRRRCRTRRLSRRPRRRRSSRSGRTREHPNRAPSTHRRRRASIGHR